MSYFEILRQRQSEQAQQETRQLPPVRRRLPVDSSFLLNPTLFRDDSQDAGRRRAGAPHLRLVHSAPRSPAPRTISDCEEIDLPMVS